MRTHIVEATNGIQNWGKFLIGQFTEEWKHQSIVSPDFGSLLAQRGYTHEHYLVLDLQTMEGAVFTVGKGLARADLAKHRIWVCPLYEPFLVWLYQQPDPMKVPHLVDLPDAPFAFAGHRRPGPEMED